MKRTLLTLILIATMTLSFFGCSGESELAGIYDQESISLVIIAGKHANSNNFTRDMMQKTREMVVSALSCTKSGDTYVAEADVTVIVNDGKPRAQEVSVGNADHLRTTAKNKGKLEEDIIDMLTGFTDVLKSDAIMAKEKGCDMQAALNQAKKVLQTKEGKEKHILILDTGISTEGHIDMHELDIMNSDVYDLMAQISETNHPDLTGIKVTFLGLGNVADPQKDLADTSGSEQKLIDFWEVYLEEKCGATLTRNIVFEPGMGEPLSSNEDLENPYPFVDPVDFDISKDEFEDTCDNITVFYSAQVGFKPNSAEFKNVEDAKEEFSKHIDNWKKFFEQNPDKIMYVVGSIAKVAVNEATVSDNPISLERAQRVVDLLTEEFGFDPHQFVVIDAGTTEFSWRNNDEFPEGKYDPAKQEANRVVAVIPETKTDLVQELKNKGEI